MKTKLLLGLALVLAGGSVMNLQAESARERILTHAEQERLAAAQHPQPFRDLPIYDVVSPDTVAGAGFIVWDGTKAVAVTAKHPHLKADPTEFVCDTNHIHLLTKIYDENDILAFKIDAPSIPAFHLMPVKSRLLHAGDKLSVVGHDGVLTGQLNSAELGQDATLIPGQPMRGNLQLLIPGVHDLAGNSGAPIILDKTGEVIGVLRGAVQMSRETLVDFRLFSFGSQPSNPDFKVESIFSLRTAGKPVENAGGLPGEILPPGLFALTPGTSIANILEERPFLPNAPTRGLGGSNYIEILPEDCPFGSATITVNNGRTIKFEMFGGWPGPTTEQAEALFNWFFAALGRPAESFSFGEHRNKPGHVSVYCQWTNEQASVILGASSSGSKVIHLELIAFPSDTPRGNILQPSWSTPISSDPKYLNNELHKLGVKP